MNIALNKASIFMASSWAGLAGLLLITAGYAYSGAPVLLSSGILVLIVSSFALLLTRKADEYTQGLWNAGASVAFGSLLVLSAGLGFVEGLIEGFTGSGRERSISADAVLTLQIASFYIGLFVKRLLGDA
jgi:hypothetical protein